MYLAFVLFLDKVLVHLDEDFCLFAHTVYKAVVFFVYV